MLMRSASLPFLLFLGACNQHPEPAPGPPLTLDPQCDREYDVRAREVLAALGACETDAECTLAEHPQGCLSPFLCSRAVARGNEAAYVDAATQLIDEYIAECGNFCREADCVSADDLRAVCDTSIGQCAVVDRPRGGEAVGD